MAQKAEGAFSKVAGSGGQAEKSTSAFGGAAAEDEA